MWMSSIVALLATNQHGRVAGFYLVANVASIAAACVLMPVLGLKGAALALLIAEVVCCWYVVRHSLTLLDDSVPAFCTSVMDFQALSRSLRKGLA